MTTAEDIIRAYYAAFNAEDQAAFLGLLTDDVVHDINQSGRETGKTAFAAFMNEMSKSYREQITDLVIMTEISGKYAAAEFTVHGEYLQTAPGLPTANGQKYTLSAGAFFTLRDSKVARISNYYNLADWLKQVG